MPNSETKMRIPFLCLLLIAPALLAQTEADAAKFAELRNQVQSEGANVPDDAVLEFLTLANSLGHPVEASYTMQNYLRENLDPEPAIALGAAEVAELAGDLRLATTRYRRYLLSLPADKNGAEPSAALANLMRLRVDVLRDHESAYRSMREFGGRFRSNPRVRKYDEWFLNLALLRTSQRRIDVKDAADHLAAIFADKLPLEQERLHYWRYLDEVLTAPYRHALEQPYAALPAIKKLAAAIRNDKARQLRYALIAADLTWRAQSATLDDDARDEAFKTVIAAAQAYFDHAPSNDSLRNIISIITDNFRTHDQQRPQRYAFAAKAFDRLNDTERRAFMGWDRRSYAMSVAEWIAAGAKHANLFRSSPEVHAFRINSELSYSVEPARLEQQANFLRGVPSDAAAIINSAVAGKGDWDKTVDHFFKHEAWHYMGDRNSLYNTLWHACSRYEQKNDDRAARVSFGKRLAGTLGVPFFGRQDFVRDYLNHAWRIGNIDERVANLKAFRWAHIERKSLDEAIKSAHSDFRRSAKAMMKNQPPEMSKGDYDRLDAAFDEARKHMPDEAPNAACKALSAYHETMGNRNAGDTLPSLIASVYGATKNDKQKLPFAHAALHKVVRHRKGANTATAHADILAQELAVDKRDQARIKVLFEDMMRDRNWTHSPPQQDREHVRRFYTILGETVEKDLARNTFEPELFTWFRQLRSNRKFRDTEAALSVVEAMITRAQKGQSVAGMPSIPELMRLLQYEFAPLQKQYPLASSFEDSYAAEIARTGMLDHDYYDVGGADNSGAVLNAAARLLLKYEAAPLGFDGQNAPCNADELWKWYRRVLTAPNTDGGLRKQLADKLSGGWGKTRFDRYAAAPLPLATDDRAALFAKLATQLDRLATSVDHWPIELRFEDVLPSLGEPKDLSESELTTLGRIFADSALRQWDRNRADTAWPGHYGMEVLLRYLHEGLLAHGRDADLFAMIPHFYTWARDRGGDRPRNYLGTLSREVADLDKMNLAVAYADGARTIAGSSLKQEIRTLVDGVIREGTQKFAAIPVPESDRRYPLFRGQFAHKAGSYDLAWDFFKQGQGAIASAYKELDPGFVTWIVEQMANREMFDPAEQLVREMMVFADQGGVLDPEVRAGLILAYAHVPFKQQSYPTARARLEQLLANKEFAGTQARLSGELKVADIDRLTKDYENATTRLEDLRRNPSSRVREDAGILLAQVHYDQGDFKESKGLLEDVIAQAPERDDAVLLSGEVDLALRHLMDATELDRMGETVFRRVIVPGTPLKVTLQDRMASVVGHAKAIEVTAISEKAGDEETFLLAPVGDIRRRFEGNVDTRLAAVKKGDGVLQVLGQDTIRYGFSEAFVKSQDLEDRGEQVLTVRTDSFLFASSGQILTREEQERIALENEIRKALQMTNEEAEETGTLSERRAYSEIKPGNPITIQVEDPDQSLSAEVDAVEIDVVTSSGDSVKGVKLEETEPHSGVFRGKLPTASAQPTAIASDNMEGRNPNNAISPKDYDPWVGSPGLGGMREFIVDLSDNVAMDTLEILADVDGHRLRKFGIQAGFNEDNYHTLGSWPDAFVPWEGGLELTLAKAGDAGTLEASDVQAFLARNEVTGEFPSVKLPVTAASVKLGRGAGGHADKLQLGGPTDLYVGRLRGAFYVPLRKLHHFVLTDPNAPEPKPGEEATERFQFSVADSSGYEIKRPFSKGVHILSVTFIATRDEVIAFDIASNLENPGKAPSALSAKPFDPAVEARIKKAVYNEPASITVSEDSGKFVAKFANARAKLLRLLIVEHEGNAPAIRKLALSDSEGNQVLPTKQDYLELRSNDILEVLSGDTVTATYADDSFIEASRKVQTTKLDVTFTDGSVSPTFIEFEQVQGESVPRYIPMIRFQVGEPVNVMASDPDLDLSDKLDVTTFEIETVAGVKKTIKALETAPHSGAFIGKFIPVAGEPADDKEIQVQADDSITITYMDKENLDPGIAWPRTALVHSALYTDPELRVYAASSSPAEATGALVTRDSGTRSADPFANSAEAYRVAFNLEVARPEDPIDKRFGAAETPELAVGSKVHVDGPILVEVLWPTIVLSEESETEIFLQTSSGRAAKPDAIGPFDTSVPGTIKLTDTPSDGGENSAGPQYALSVTGDPYAAEPLIDGRFTFSIPVQLGDLPGSSLIDEPNEHPLSITGNDDIFLGFRYTDEAGAIHWITERIALAGDSVVDIMDSSYQEAVGAVYVGDKIYFRIIDKLEDKTAEKDSLEITLKTSSGHQIEAKLIETFEHTGIFKGAIKPLYEKVVQDADLDVLACKYGDTVDITYTRADGTAISAKVEIYKGSDAVVQPFSKRFKDPEIAVKTQFAIAEAYFEQAKRHRKLGRNDLAKEEIHIGKKVLEEAIRDFPEFDFRDHAEYLLANLAMEFANDEEDEIAREKHYLDAIGKFSRIVLDYPESEFAPRSQYKKALAFEKMGMLDQASEEYVKLSYQYPDHELIAETIVRLGQYFWAKARAIEKESEPLVNSGDQQERIDGEKAMREARVIYRTAAEVFGRLSARFPDHNLAGKTLVLAAQSWMQSNEHKAAIATFSTVLDQYEDDIEIAPEAMYWQGEVHFKGKDYAEAYKAWKKLTWDYPKTKWARFARTRLSDPEMIDVSEEL
jgi:TolA-binding protein